MTIVSQLLKISIAALVLGLGMRGLSRDLRGFLARPSLIIRVLIARGFLIPLVVMTALSALGATSSEKIGLMLLAISPAWPLPWARGGEESERAELALATSTLEILFSILALPFWLAVMSRWLMVNTSIEPMAVMQLVAVLFLLPLAVGGALRLVAPALIEKGSRLVLLASQVALGVALVAFFADALPTMRQLGMRFDLLVASVAGATLGAAHVAAGRIGANRSALALACVTRHPALALLVALGNFPDELVLPAVVTSFMIGTLVSLSYALLTRPRVAPSLAQAGTTGM